MKLTSNPELNKHLHEKINEWNNFTDEKKLHLQIQIAFWCMSKKK